MASGKSAAGPHSSCAQPDCTVTTNLKKCSRCKAVSYCSLAHQKEHWKRHKATCASTAARLAVEARLLAPLAALPPDLAEQVETSDASRQNVDARLAHAAYLLTLLLRGSSGTPDAPLQCNAYCPCCGRLLLCKQDTHWIRDEWCQAEHLPSDRGRRGKAPHAADRYLRAALGPQLHKEAYWRKEADIERRRQDGEWQVAVCSWCVDEEFRNAVAPLLEVCPKVAFPPYVAELAQESLTRLSVVDTIPNYLEQEGDKLKGQGLVGYTHERKAGKKHTIRWNHPDLEEMLFTWLLPEGCGGWRPRTAVRYGQYVMVRLTSVARVWSDSRDYSRFLARRAGVPMAALPLPRLLPDLVGLVAGEELAAVGAGGGKAGEEAAATPSAAKKQRGGSVENMVQVAG